MYTAQFWCAMPTCVCGWGDVVRARAARACPSLYVTFRGVAVHAQCSFVVSLLLAVLLVSTPQFWCAVFICVCDCGDVVCARAAVACPSLYVTFPRAAVRAQCSFVASLLWAGLRVSTVPFWCVMPTCVCIRLWRARRRRRRRVAFR
jgi:hypothetical protein